MASTPMAVDSPAPTPLPNGISNTKKLSDVISSYRPTKLFRRDGGSRSSNSPCIHALDFDDEGALLVTTESDNKLQIYNVKEGKHQSECQSLKYGAANAKFTHKDTCIIYSSTKVNDLIRYYSTHNNNFIRYFEGHEKYVTCLSMHPGLDAFVSCSEDNTVRIWDAGTKNAQGKLLLNGAYLAAWDPSGNVFAVASPIAQSVLLYDFRNYDKEPFATFDLFDGSSELGTTNVATGWTKLEFSNDGKSILLGTSGTGHLLLDAFDGSLKATLLRTGDRPGARRLGVGERNAEHIDLSSNEYLHPTTGDVCFTSDGRYVLSGSRGQNIQVWDTLRAATTRDLYPQCELEHKGDTGVVAFNPRYNFFASADKELVFWVPDPNY